MCLICVDLYWPVGSVRAILIFAPKPDTPGVTTLFSRRKSSTEAPDAHDLKSRVATGYKRGGGVVTIRWVPGTHGTEKSARRSFTPGGNACGKLARIDRTAIREE